MSRWQAFRHHIFILISLLGVLAPAVTQRLFPSKAADLYGRAGEKPGTQETQFQSAGQVASLQCPEQE